MSKRVKVKCCDCGQEFERSNKYLKEYYGNDLSRFRCTKCYRAWRKNNWFNELSDEKKKEISEKRSKISKNIWKKMDPEKKSEIFNDLGNRRKNRSEEEKAKTREKVKNTWRNKTDEEKAYHSAVRSDHTKTWWHSLSKEEQQALTDKATKSRHAYYANLSPEEKQKEHERRVAVGYMGWNNKSDEEKAATVERLKQASINFKANMTEEQRKSLSEKISAARKNYFSNMTDEERKEFGKHKKNWWDSASEEKKDAVFSNMRKGHAEWLENLDMKTRFELNKIISESSQKYWDNLNQEEFISRAKKYAESFNSEERDYNKLNKNEIDLANMLSLYHIIYTPQYFNTTIHPAFNALFNKNDATGGRFTSPFHQWDFVIHTPDEDILVDIDGSIHNSELTKNACVLLNNEKSTTIAEIVEFYDNKRIYQTDGLSAYVVRCYDDNLTEDTPVTNLLTGEELTLQSFLLSMKILYLTEKELKELIDDSK